MSRSVWSILGVPANSDRAAVRRGYAAKLRQTHPEDDPEGFMALRAAYDQALAMADARERYGAQDAADDEDEPYWEDDPDYDDSAREAVFTATPTPTPTQPAAILAEPAEPPSPDAELLEGRDRDLAEFETRMNALASQLTSPWAQDEGQLEAAFRAILAAPAMAEINIRAHAEEWIAGLLASNMPKSDALLLQAIEAFGWDGAHGQRGQSRAVAAVLHRIDEWRTIEALTSRGDQFHFAFSELTRPPRRGWAMRLKAMNPGVAKRVRTLIEFSQWQMPGLRHSFNTETVAWWENYFAQPRMTLGRLAIAPAFFVAVLALAALFKPADPLRTILLAAGGVIALALPWAHLRTMGRLAHARETGVQQLPRWAETGWIAAVFVLPVAAMFVPPSPAWAVALLLLAAIAIQWTQLMSGGRRGLTVENPLSWVLTIGFFGFFGLVGLIDMALPAQIVVIAIALVILHARAVAIDPLIEIGERLTARFYVPGIAAIGALVFLAVISPLQPPLLPAWPAAGAALLVNAMFHTGIPLLRYAARIGIAVAFLVAAVISIPDRPGSSGLASGATYAPLAPSISGRSTDIAMQRLETDQPGFALMRANNPALYGELRTIVEQHIAGALDQAQAGRRFDERLNAAHRRMLASAPDDLLEQGLKLEMARRRSLLLKNPAACAGTGEIRPGDLPEALTRVGLTHAIQIVSVPRDQRVTGSTGKPVANTLVFETAAKRLGIGTREMSRRLRDDAPDTDRCAARIEMLQVILEQPPADIAATVRETAANPL